LPACQRLGLGVEQHGAVPAQSQVVGQLAANQAGADDEHVLWPAVQRRAQALVGAQVVDAPDQVRRQGLGQLRLGAMGEHQLVVPQWATGGAQGARTGADVDRLGVAPAAARPGGRITDCP